MSIQEIIQGCSKGRKEAQELLYKIYSRRLYAVCIRYLSNRDDAADVLQEVMLRVYNNIHRFKPEKEHSLDVWMHRITVNTALNHLRKYNPVSMFENIAVYEEILPSSTSDYTEDSEDEYCMPDTQALLAMITALPAGYRTVFNLYVFEQYTHKEIAEKLKISENTSKTQLMKARRMLAGKINEIIHKNNILKVI